MSRKKKETLPASAALAAAGLALGPAPDPGVLTRLGLAPGQPMRASRLRLLTVLTHDPRWKERIRWDTFRRVVRFDGRTLEDVDLTEIACWLEEVYGATPGRELTHECVDKVARAHPLHPVRDYLGALAWDGVPRLSRLLTDGFGAEDTPLHHTQAVRFAIGLVARVMAPGCKLDTMLVLVGPQGVGKSRGLRALLPDPSWMADTPLDLQSKDAYVVLDGVWLYEVAELSGMRRREAERVKAFLSSPEDRYRPPYGRLPVCVPRQCVFVGTTNEPEFLEDATGSRRFWPVRVGRVDQPWIVANRDALWAEAVARYRAHEPWHLSATEEQARARAAEPMQRTDPFMERLSDWLSTQTEPFSTEIAITEGLGVALERADRGLQTRVGPMLRALGCTKHQARTPGGRRWLWTPPARGDEVAEGVVPGCDSASEGS